MPGPHHTNVCKIWRNFVGFQQIPLLHLAIFLVKGIISIGFFSLSMSKIRKQRAIVYPELKEVSFCAVPPRIDYYRESPPPPHATPPSRYKIWEFKNKHTNSRHVKACLAGA